MMVGDRVRLAGPDNIDGWVVETPPYGQGIWVRWDWSPASEADPAALEKIDDETPLRRRR